MHVLHVNSKRIWAPKKYVLCWIKVACHTIVPTYLGVHLKVEYESPEPYSGSGSWRRVSEIVSKAQCYLTPKAHCNGLWSSRGNAHKAECCCDCRRNHKVAVDRDSLHQKVACCSPWVEHLKNTKRMQVQHLFLAYEPTSTVYNIKCGALGKMSLYNMLFAKSWCTTLYVLEVIS